MRGDHLGRDRRCPPVSQLRSAGAVCRAGCHRVFLRRQTLTGASVAAGLARAALGGIEAAKCAARRGSPDHAYYHKLAAKHDGNNPTLAVERKILRPSNHTLRELGDAAMALPDTPPQEVAA
jgi:hypothetical protein